MCSKGRPPRRHRAADVVLASGLRLPVGARLRTSTSRLVSSSSHVKQNMLLGLNKRVKLPLRQAQINRANGAFGPVSIGVGFKCWTVTVTVASHNRGG